VEWNGLIKGRLRGRYKRFFADIELENGTIVTAHCPNPGRMLGLLDDGTDAMVSPISGGKLAWRLEALRERDTWVGVNTQWPNRLIARAIAAGLIPSLSGYGAVRPEVAYGERSRIDLHATGHTAAPDAWIEIKNVHLSRTSGLAEFPDCVTERGAKHLRELAVRVEAGERAVVVFCVQRSDVNRFTVARDCDPGFARAFDSAWAAGVEVLAMGFDVSESGLRFDRFLELI